MWLGGSVASTNPLVNQVSTTTSAETSVEAQLCSDALYAKIWILWSTLNILVAPPEPANAPSFAPQSNTLGVVYYDINGNSVASTSSNAVVAYGQNCVVATLTPVGVHRIIPTGWSFFQERMSHDFNNGSKSTRYYDSSWQPDGPTSGNYMTTPDALDEIYEIDSPNIGAFASSTSETYNNFYDYITWNGQLCSSTNNFWNFEGRWNSTNTPQVTYTALSTGTIQLPTNALYNH
jgi:hypothetical protein